MRKRVLIASSIRPTLIYLFISSLDEIKNTAYFFIHDRRYKRDEIKAIRDKLPDSFFFYLTRLKPRFLKYKLLNHLDIIIQKFIKHTVPYLFNYFTRNLRWPFLRDADIYAYDATYIACSLLAGKKYTFLEDGLLTYEAADGCANADTKHMSPGLRLWMFLAAPFGPQKQGTSDLAEKIILTGIADIPKCYESKNTEIISLPKLWKESAQEKRDFIMNFFDLTNEDLRQLNQRDIIFVDQPLAHDALMTEDEQVEMMRKIFDHYGASRILLKTHYRNPLKYDGVFPGVLLWDKPTPMELINLCGVKFTKAVTVNSTAVLSFPEGVKIDWLGADINSPFFSHFSEETRRIFINDFIRVKVLPDRIKAQLNTKEAE